MKSAKHLIICLIFLTLLFSVPFAAEQGIVSGPEGNNAEILLRERFLTLNKDGSTEVIEHLKVKILTEQGAKGWREIPITYDPNFEKIKRIEAYTITPDGKKIKPKRIHDYAPQKSFPTYSGKLVKVIALSDLVKGNFVEYTITSEVASSWMDGHLVDEVFLIARDPIEIFIYKVTVPADKDLKFSVFNHSVEPKIENSNKAKTYTWEIQNAPALAIELYMPSPLDIVSRIIVSTVSSWDQVWKWNRSIFSEKADMNSELKRKTYDLVKNCKTKEEMAKAIYAYVQNDIQYLGLEFGKHVYTPHAATDVFKNKYGDCKGKVALLMSMLRTVGIRSYASLIRTKEFAKLDKSIPSPQQFNHIILVAEIDGGLKWFDATVNYLWYGDLPYNIQGLDAFVLKEEKGEFIQTPILPSESNMQRVEIEASLNENGAARGKIVFRPSGYADTILKNQLNAITEQERQQAIQMATYMYMPSAKIVKCEFANLHSRDKSLIIEADFENPKLATRSGKYLILDMPSELEALIACFSQIKRRYPIDFQMKTKNIVKLTVNLPSGWSAEDLSANINKLLSFGIISVKRAMSGSRLISEESIAINSSFIPVEKYQVVSKEMEDINKRYKKHIVLVKRGIL